MGVLARGTLTEGPLVSYLPSFQHDYGVYLGLTDVNLPKGSEKQETYQAYLAAREADAQTISIRKYQTCRLTTAEL